MSATDVGLLGTAHSGKSTWIGALYLGMHRRRPFALSLDFTPAQIPWFEVQSRPLLRYEYPKRSNTGRPPTLDVPVRWRDESGAPFSLRVGDYDGEDIDRLFERRHVAWSEEWAARLSGGLVLVVRPTLVSLVTSDRLALTALDPDSAAATYGKDLTSPEEEKRSAVAAPSTVALVELLQVARELAGGTPSTPVSRPLAVVLSCWDEVSPEERADGPTRWLGRRLPLLDDYLALNHSRESWRVFGLSATGVDLRKEATRLDDADADVSELGFVEWDGGRSEDISLPLAWVLRGDEVLRRP